MINILRPGDSDLASGMILVKADFNAYLKQYTVHKVLLDNNRFNIGPGSIRLSIIDDRECCHFIYMNGVYIGGVILDSYKIKHPFLLPGYQGYLEEIICSLHKKTMDGADLKKGIACLPSNTRQAGIFHSLGYETVRKMRCMVGTLGSYNWDVPDGYVFRQPAKSDINLIADLFYNANINEPWHQPVTVDGFARGTLRFFDSKQVDKVIEASTLCFDSNTGDAVGGCLISIDEGYPFVYDLHILKQHRRKGIASSMMKRAMGMMADGHEFMRLFVIDGNPAMKLYENLGFIFGSPVYILKYS